MANSEIAFPSEAEAVAYAKAEGIAVGDNIERRGVGAVILNAAIAADADTSDADLVSLAQFTSDLAKKVTNIAGNTESLDAKTSKRLDAIEKSVAAIQDSIALLNKAAAAK